MTAKIATALHEVMSKVSYVQKTGRNDFHKYNYAGESDLLAVLRPAMIEAGLMLVPSVKDVSPVDEHGNVTVQMEYTLMHKDGDVWPEKIGGAGMGNDRAKNGTVGDKGVYKAITGANKYVLFKLFQIETGDDPEHASDHDKGAPPPDPLPKKDARETYSALERDMRANRSKADLKRWISDPDVKALRAKLPADWDTNLKQAAADYGRDLPDGDPVTTIQNEFPGARVVDERSMETAQ